MDIRLTFDGIASVYERARPSYPAELFDTLFAALPEYPRILELGPGTGQATVDLLARGAQVTAVEIGSNLAHRLQVKFAHDDKLRVINDSFENAPVPHHSFDAVTVATAYHWVDAEAQLTRPIELLRAGGVLGVIDLIQVDSTIDQGYYDRVTPIYERFGESKYDPPKTYETAQPAIAARLSSSDLYDAVEVHRKRWDQTYTPSTYRDLLLSYSGTQMMCEPARSNMVDELVAVIDDDFDGEITRPLVATLTLARVAGS